MSWRCWPGCWTRPGPAGRWWCRRWPGWPGSARPPSPVHAGHAALLQGWFGGGVLFVDLHGYDDQPVEPGQALDGLLRALGVPGEHIPPGTEQRAALYRSRLAWISEPVLVVADNASVGGAGQAAAAGGRAAQSAGHLPAHPGRAGRPPGRRPHPRPGRQRCAAGRRAARLARPEDVRITGEREAAIRLAGLCCGLPLALQITAALLKADPTLGTGDLAEELAVESERLERLAYDDGSGHGASSVRAAFDLSYRRLDGTLARLFRLLPVNPGPDVSTASAAALADLPIARVRRVLAGLARAHLVVAAPGEWSLADARPGPPLRPAALRRGRGR